MNTTDLATINQHKIIPTIQPQMQQHNKVVEAVNLTQNTPQIRNQNHSFSKNTLDKDRSRLNWPGN